MAEKDDKPTFRRKRKKKTALGAKNKPFKLHDYLHPSSGYMHASGGGN